MKHDRDLPSPISALFRDSAALVAGSHTLRDAVARSRRQRLELRDRARTLRDLASRPKESERHV